MTPDGCRFCDSSLPLEDIGGRLVCPCCSRPAEDASPAAPEAAGRASVAPLDLDPIPHLSALRAHYKATAHSPETGRFVLGNKARFETGHRDPDLVAPGGPLYVAHRERCAAIERDIGGAEALTASQRALVGELARLQLVAEALGDKVLTDGPLTGKGRARASVGLWLSVLDRQERLSRLLGLRRAEKPVTDLAAAFHDTEAR